MNKLLVVDLDNTLVKTDILVEALISLIKNNLYYLVLLPFWILKGKTFLKNKVAEKIKIEAKLLPYRESVITLIKEHKKNGAKVVLASASPHVWVTAVANHIGLFDEFIGTTKENLKGLAKYEYIKNHYGLDEFTYVGDSQADMPIWDRCKFGVLVNPKSIIRMKYKENKNFQMIHDSVSLVPALIKQLRPHQWAKNGLLALPLLLAHNINSSSVVNLLYGILSFSLAASTVYIFNDVFDLDADRNHRKKKFRPLAAGDFSIGQGLFLLLIVFLASIFIGGYAGSGFLTVLTIYFCLNFFYTMFLKKVIILDIIILSGMYTLRIFAGAAAANVMISHWLLSFSTLFFFSLACVKRYTECLRSQNKISIDGRGYRSVDHAAIQAIGIGAGLLSILVVLLYLQSTEVRALYQKISNMWMITPILLYWVSRVWLLASREQMNDDPVVFAVQDKASWICGLLLALILGASI